MKLARVPSIAANESEDLMVRSKLDCMANLS